MTNLPRILIIEDDPLISESLGLLLQLRAYEVQNAVSGGEALAFLDRNRPDLILLDLGLPDVDGVELCERIRQGYDGPIIVLSARASVQDKVAALEAGADDYVTKPFSSDELLARIRVALGRVWHKSGAGSLERGALVIDFDRRRVHVGDREVRLAPKEFELLAYLARHPNRVIPRQAILVALWGPRMADRPGTLSALVAKLRRKIEPVPGEPRYLVSEPWVGYRLITEPSPTGG